MKRNLLFNQVTAIGKRFAMVLTMLLIVGVTSVWGETISDNITFGNPGNKNSNQAIKLTQNSTFLDHNSLQWNCSSDAAITSQGGELSACYAYAGNRNNSSSYIEVSWTADKDYLVTDFTLNAYANGTNPKIILTIDNQETTHTAPKSKGTTYYAFSTIPYSVLLPKGKIIKARIQKDASKAVTGIVSLSYSFTECTTEPTVCVIPKCGGDGGGTWLVVIEWFATF